jgi:succinyl-diaminopimelate desuccinylase
MPGEAVGYVDIRTTLAQEHGIVRDRLREILRSLAAEDADFQADIEFIEDRPVVGITKEEPIARVVAAAYTEITGRQPVYNGVPGATDGTFLRAWKGIPCLVNGPGPRHIPHQVDEYVDIGELFESALIYVLSAERFLAGGGV